MDMRTRLERKMDKLMAQKRKNWEIEAKLKAPDEPMDCSYLKSIEKEVCPQSTAPKKEKPKRVPKPKAQPKRKPKVLMSRKKETQSLLQRNFEFNCIGSGRPSLKADSAGHKLDNCYHLRTEQRLKIKNALTSGEMPVGSLMPMSVAIRIESAIFRVLSQDPKEYEMYCEHCASYIRHKHNQAIRLELVMGHLDPDDFAFLPTSSTPLKDMIYMRICFKKAEEEEKVRQLKKGIV